MSANNEKKELVYTIAYAMGLYVITYIIVHKAMLLAGSDYDIHANWAAGIRRDTIIDFFVYHTPYFMWHIIVRMVNVILCIPMEYAVPGVSALINVIVYYLVNMIMKYNKVSHSELISVFLLLVGPIYIPWYNVNYYLGQWSPNTWHNPTNLMVKPFVVYIFFIMVQFIYSIRNEKEIKRSEYGILSVLIFLSALAKPSFLQAFIPGLGLFILIECIKDKFINKKYVYICLMFVPGVFLVLFQFISSFYTGFVSDGVGIGWLEVASHYSPNILISLLLLLLFPLEYLALNYKKVKSHIDIQLSVYYAVAAWLEYALLYEKGARIYSANFSWAFMLSTFILWMVTLMHFIKDVKEMELTCKKHIIKLSVLLVTLFLHLFCGCYYIFKILYFGAWW